MVPGRRAMAPLLVNARTQSPVLAFREMIQLQRRERESEVRDQVGLSEDLVQGLDSFMDRLSCEMRSPLMRLREASRALEVQLGPTEILELERSAIDQQVRRLTFLVDSLGDL